MNNDRIYYSHDAEMRAMHDRTMLAILFLTCGLGIGAALVLLFAPTSGRSTRDNLAKTMGQGWNSSRDALEPMVNRLEEEFADLRKSVEERLRQSS